MQGKNRAYCNVRKHAKVTHPCISYAFYNKMRKMTRKKMRKIASMSKIAFKRNMMLKMEISSFKRYMGFPTQA